MVKLYAPYITLSNRWLTQTPETSMVNTASQFVKVSGANTSKFLYQGDHASGTSSIELHRDFVWDFPYYIDNQGEYHVVDSHANAACRIADRVKNPPKKSQKEQGTDSIQKSSPENDSGG